MKTTIIQSRSVEGYKLTVPLRKLIERVKALNEYYSAAGKGHPGHVRLNNSDYSALDKRVRQESDNKFNLSMCVLFGYPVIPETAPAPRFSLEAEAA